MMRYLTILVSLAFVALIFPAFAQSPIADHVVINEVDTNPPGDDAASPTEWVELYNPTDVSVDLGGWKIASTTVLKQTYTIPSGTSIKPGQFLTYSYKTVWFTDTNEKVELRDNNGFVVDATPIISDVKNDFSSWQRIYDGYDLDSSDDWKFEKSTAGSSNGQIPITIETEGVFVTVNSSKTNYLFGETAVIQGHISKEVFKVQLGDFKPESISLSIKGPNYNSQVVLYPDLNLNFKTTLSLNSVLGIQEGLYSVVVTYAGVTSSTSFSVGEKITESENPTEQFFSIVTDKSQYLPGETVSISGITSEIIPLQGLKYELRDPNGKLVASGTLYPTNGKFSGNIFLTTVNPVYGTYVLTGDYLEKSSASFEVVRDLKEDVLISLWTDKEFYGLGDTVTITGRLNDRWISSMDLEILQTRNTALDTGAGSGDFAFKILDVVRLEGDSTFKYSFKIPSNDQRLGDYRIKVSKEIGSAVKTIHVVKDTSIGDSTREPISVTTDKLIYNFGDSISISGIVSELSHSTSDFPIVEVSIKNKDGTPLSIIGGTGAGRLSTTGSSVSYDFTAIPDPSGRYLVNAQLNRNIFTEGQYLVTVKYLKLTNSAIFSVMDILKTEGTEPIRLNKDVYGLGETVFLSGILPPTGDHSVSISLTKPDGSVTNSGATLSNQQFSWTWITPISATQAPIKTDDRSLTTTNLGVYKIHVSVPSYNKDVFFKVSLDPSNDSLSISPLSVSTSKPIYKAGEKLKVLGSVIVREQGTEGLVVPERVSIVITSEKSPTKAIFQSTVYPEQGGNFQSEFDLPITIFSEGQYKVKATYLKKQTTTSFGVVNDFSYGSDEPISLLVSTDKTEYHPGDQVLVYGKPNKLIYLEKYDVSVFKLTGNEITCGSFTCGVHKGEITTIKPSPNGSFSYQFSIPNSASSIGKYEITVESDFEIKKILVNVVEKPAEEKTSKTIIEKVTGIQEDQVYIYAEEKSLGGVKVGPRVLLGSLVTSPRGEESNVNLRVLSESGVCVIGPNENCLVKESTRKPGDIYEVVQVDGVNLKVRYSGPDARVEKFSILPETPDALLPNSIWNVQVVKDNQVSRLYYKINYSPLE